jgi:glycosyl transferase family 87
VNATSRLFNTTSDASPSPWADPPLAAALAAALIVFALAWSVLHVGPFDDAQIRDTPVYEGYGDAIARGDVPYRDFRLEYPPGALPAFALPALVVGADASQETYRGAFEVGMFACGAALVALVGFAVRRLDRSGRAAAGAVVFAAVAPLALGSVVLSRFDLWPAAVVAAGAAAFVAGRDRFGSGLLGFAVAVKLYAAVLLPVALVWVLRRRGRRDAAICAAVAAAVVAVCFLPFFVVAPEGVASSVWRQLSRPLQLESLGAVVLVLLNDLFGVPVVMEGSHGSQNVGGALGDVAGTTMTALQAGTLVWLWMRFGRGTMTLDRLVQYAAAALVAFVALGKVLSPQFLIWLVPLVPLVAGRRGLASTSLLGLALVVTHLWFPQQYWDYAREFDSGVTVLVLVRDVVLVALLVVLVRDDAGVTRRASAAARS